MLLVGLVTTRGPVVGPAVDLGISAFSVVGCTFTTSEASDRCLLSQLQFMTRSRSCYTACSYTLTTYLVDKQSRLMRYGPLFEIEFSVEK